MCHYVAEDIAVRYLIDEAEPRSDVSDGLWRREVTDCAGMLVTWLNVGRRDDEASKFHRVGAKYKLSGILHNSMSTANV